jgi:hypothetical protein
MKNGSYELVVAPAEYPGQLYRGRCVYEHHLVWWQHTGELLKPGEVIHHENHNKRDNRFENLRKKTNGTHVREHNLERPAETRSIKCEYCKMLITRLTRSVRSTLKSRPNARFYCTRSCATKNFWREKSHQ